MLLDGKAKVRVGYGVIVAIAEVSLDKLRPVGDALINALKAEGIPAEGRKSEMQGEDPNAIHIMIGKRE